MLKIPLARRGARCSTSFDLALSRGTANSYTFTTECHHRKRKYGHHEIIGIDITDRSGEYALDSFEELTVYDELAANEEKIRQLVQGSGSPFYQTEPSTKLRRFFPNPGEAITVR